MFLSYCLLIKWIELYHSCDGTPVLLYFYFSRLLPEHLSYILWQEWIFCVHLWWALGAVTGKIWWICWGCCMQFCAVVHSVARVLYPVHKLLKLIPFLLVQSNCWMGERRSGGGGASVCDWVEQVAEDESGVAEWVGRFVQHWEWYVVY